MELLITPTGMSVSVMIYLAVSWLKFRYDYVYHSEIEGWLKQNNIPATWQEARLRCHLEGAELASPLDLDFINILKSRSHLATWTGVHSSFSKGYYFSIEGVPLLRMPISWAPGEPDNYDNKEQCIIMMPNGTFADVCCDESFPYFCYKKSKSEVFNVCGTTDPNYTYETRTGSCYKLHNHMQTWDRAFMTCAGEGGYLAIMDTAVETQVLREIISRYPLNKIYGASVYKDDFFVGIHDWGDAGVWTTIHGQPVDRLIDTGVISWSQGQPKNITYNGLGESCGCIRRDGSFNDAWCHLPLGFICEKAPDSLERTEDDE
ncbi:hypothetical protein K1T71_006914 [Dendrolimus kikuchii]|uniref:Uncharacterized protein n=1 Tax=Dendrolimus kikuchii TaxID=765133 RepID=A0ACC1CZB0_9NEOP|nr:hypothetical protein K1T71_006914 [Dendrolimus kikuchii]